MNQQTITYIAITAVLIALAIFGYEYTQEAEIKQAASEKCCSQKQLDNFNLKLETSPCFGRCPVFLLEISSGGKLRVIGKDFVDFKELDKVLTKEQLTSIGKLVYVSNYFEIKDIYGYNGKGCTSNATDHPSSKWSIVLGEDNSTMNYYKGCFGAPKELALFEGELIRRLGLESELL